MSLDAAIEELRELNEDVPKPLRLPTTGEVDAAERRLGVTFHPDYRKYLLAASNVVYGTKEPCTVAPAAPALPGTGTRGPSHRRMPD